MSSPKDTLMQDGDDDLVHKPFTVEENMHQLNAIDSSVVELMKQAATALNALTVPSSSPSTDAAATADATNGTAPAPAPDPAAQKEAFRAATDSFLTTLHSVDVRMKRQIFALEEAGIVNLSSSAARQDGKGGNGGKASLQPNGVGAVGNLDVGWLNSRGTRVERDTEAELWGKMREFLEQNGEQMKF